MELGKEKTLKKGFRESETERGFAGGNEDCYSWGVPQLFEN